MTAFLLTSSLTMVLAVNAAARGNESARRLWLLATMACGTGFVILHGKEWSHLISEGLRLPIFPAVPHQDVASEFVNVSKEVPQFAATFFRLSRIRTLHDTHTSVYHSHMKLVCKLMLVL